MNPVKKKDVKTNAELKTISDYALILEHVNGFSADESRKRAMESFGEPLFEKLMNRNTELFKTGSVIIMG